MVKSIVFVFFYLVLSMPVFPDAADDVRFLLSAAGVPVPAYDTRGKPAVKETNEFKMILWGTLKVYQLVISSQDKPSCTFIPSCSRYAQEAISKYGPVPGIIMAADRLQRCHGMGFGYYPRDHDTGKFIDPPERNRLRS